MGETKELHTGKYLRLVDQEGYEYVHRVGCSGVAVIVAVTNDDEVILVDQYRPAVGKSVVEIPAGLVGDEADFAGEAMSEGAARELEEETGYRPGKMELVTVAPPSPGMSSEMVHFYRASDLTKVGEGGGNEFEDINVHLVGRSDVDQWLKKREAEGFLVDAKVYSCLYFVRDQ
jgi:ADP-ribose pyrophosphatase